MRIFFLSIIVIVVCVSCQKEMADGFFPYVNDPFNDTVWVDNIPVNAASYRLSGEFEVEPAVDSFNALTTSVIKLKNEVELTIPGGICIFSNGMPVSGKVIVSCSFLKNKGDLVKLSKPASSYNSPLETEGAFLLNATSNGEKVFIKPGKKINISIFNGNPDNQMSVYYGVENPVGPLPPGTNPLFTWILANDSSRVATFSQNIGSNIVKGYNIFAGQFNWVNCAKPASSVVFKSKYSVLLPANYTNTNTTVYAVYKHSNVVIQLQGDKESRSFFHPQMPMNEEVVLISLSLRGTAFYLGVKETTATSNGTLSIVPVLKTKLEIQQVLDQL